MRSQRRPTSWLTRFAAPILLGLAVASTFACSLIVENRSQQCDESNPCPGGSACDPVNHVCIQGGTSSATGAGGSTSSSTASSSGSSTSSSSTGGGGGCNAGGCYSCPPTTNDEFLNACTGSACKPFDNKTRCKNLAADGGLPPLPVPSDAGGGG